MHVSPMASFRILLLTCVATGLLLPPVAHTQERARARDLGVAPGIFAPGKLNAITAVAGVRVGQVTVVEGERVRTGVTAILAHPGNAWRSRVPAAVHVGNGYGKFAGSTQVNELGELETPILLTCTLCVWKAADAMAAWMLEQPGMEQVRSINPVVGETNDGDLNDIRSRPLTAAAVRQALESARPGPVQEGSVGAGTGTIAFGWKGGIGTSSRVLPASLGGWTVGVLVQSNFGGVLQVAGAPVGRELGKYSFRDAVATQVDGKAGTADDHGDGSVIIIIATDAPLGDRNLGRVASRAMMGLGRTGSSASNGSGDYALAFSTAGQVRRDVDAPRYNTAELANQEMSAVFQASVDAVEEAVYNSLFMATTVTGNGTTARPFRWTAWRQIRPARRTGTAPARYPGCTPVTRAPLSVSRRQQGQVYKQVCVGKAAEDHFVDAGMLLQFGAYAFQCNACRGRERIAVDARADARKGDAAQFHGSCQVHALPVAGGEQIRLAMRASAPDGSDRVDHVGGGQPVAARHLRFAGSATAEQPALAGQLRTRGAMDRTVHAAPSEERGVGRIDDCIHCKRGDIGLDRPYRHGMRLRGRLRPRIGDLAEQARGLLGVVDRRVRFIRVPFHARGLYGACQHGLAVSHAGHGHGVENTEGMERVALVPATRDRRVEEVQVEVRVVADQDRALAAVLLHRCPDRRKTAPGLSFGLAGGRCVVEHDAGISTTWGRCRGAGGGDQVGRWRGSPRMNDPSRPCRSGPPRFPAARDWFQSKPPVSTSTTTGR